MVKKRKVILTIFLLYLLFSSPLIGLGQAILPLPQYIELVQQRIKSNIIYPTEAKDKGWEGVVIVKFTLRGDGQIKELGIAKSSGYPLLDEAAMLAIKKSSPYPSLESYQETTELEIVLPINYVGFEKPASPAVGKITPELPQGPKKKVVRKIAQPKTKEEKADSLSQINPLYKEALSCYSRNEIELAALTFKEILLIAPEEKKAKLYLDKKIPLRKKQLELIEQRKKEKEVKKKVPEKSEKPAKAKAPAPQKEALPPQPKVRKETPLPQPAPKEQSVKEAPALKPQPKPEAPSPVGPVKKEQKEAQLPRAREKILPPQKKEKPVKETLPPPQPKQEVLLPQSQKELGGFIQLAIKNSQPIQIARQETELAQLKTKEAQRNLFPAVKLEGIQTEGQAEKLSDFEEREVRAEVDQPLFYGGRLINAFSKAKVNFEISKGIYDRLTIDVTHKAEVAYYNVLAGRLNLQTHEEIRQEARKILEIVQRQFAADLVTPLENLATQSWYEQISFQIDSLEQDVAMAELTFMQALNISELPEITPERLEIKKLNLNLTQCLEAGFKKRPEMHLSELLVRFNEYGKKIEEAKNNFMVDLNSSYGYYEGGYKTETLRSSEAWYVGFKVTKPWGGSTISTSAGRKESGINYGEATSAEVTRNEANSISAAFNLLDNLQRLSDEKKAKIEFQRSLSDLNETKKTVTFEIKEAYLNCQKALMQATAAQSEAEFRRREVDVLKTRAQVGEVEFSNVAEALTNLARAQTTYIQAIGNYFVSLVNLKKATGYGIKI